MKLISKTFRDIGCILAGGMFALSLVSCGGGGGSPGTVSGSSGATATTVGSVSLLFSSSELKSAGATGTEVTVTALVKNQNNVALTDIPVTFSADSGALSVVDSASDKNGQAKATLSTSGDRTNRRITVTVKAGSQTTTGTVDVVGTTINIAGSGTVSSSGTGDYTITVKDSSDNAVPNVPITFSSQKGSKIAVKSSGGGSATAPLTNSQGQVILTLTPAQSTSDVLTISSQGTSATAAIAINTTKLSVSVVGSDGNTLSEATTSSSCVRMKSHYEVAGVAQSGTINLSTTRGTLYSDSSCSSALASSSVTLSNGDSAPTYLKSNTAGVATITATVPNGPSTQTSVEFVAALTASATISLQADPAVIGTNTGSGQSEKSTVTAIVRDGSSFNNLVKNAVVEFSIVDDKSGGSLSNPSVVTTASNGSASVVFIAGTADTSKDGVKIQAKIQGTTKTATATLTVAKKSLFISAGTGNKLATPNSSTYQQDYIVVVTDSAGNRVPNVTITASVFPTRYAKGVYGFDPTKKIWEPNRVATCANEDVTKDGILDSGEDFNINGKLDPGIPVAVTASATTDSTGTATVSLVYPRDRANWVEVELTVRGAVSGTESVYQTQAYFLPALTADLSDQNISPPGEVSPYGSDIVCSSKN